MKINAGQSFHVLEITSEEAQSQVNSLESRKLGSYKNKPTKLLTETSEVSWEHLAKIWNEKVTSGKNFPNELKLADITLIFKKEVQHQ